jgi:ABC-type multidrug transport system fused ATPase/permease subunit
LVSRELLGDKRILGSLAVGIAGFALAQAAMALAAGSLGRALVNGAGNSASEGPLRLPLLGLCYVGLGAAVVKSATSILLAFAESRASSRVGSALRSEITRNLLAEGLHDAAPRVLATIAVRIREIEHATSAGVLRWVHAVAQLVPLAVALILVSPTLAFGSTVVLAPFAYVLSRLRRRWRRASEQAQALVEELHAGTDELVKNLDLWRSYGKAEHVVHWMDGAAYRAAANAARVDATRAALSGGNEVLGTLALLGAIVLASRAGFSLADGRLLGFAAVFFMAYRPLRDWGDAKAFCARGVLATRALVQLRGTLNAHAVQREPAPARIWPRAALCVRDFGSAASGPRTTFTLSPGEMVCIVGPTGSGKSTLLRALLGLVPSAGRAEYAGAELPARGVGPSARPFAWVPQDAPLVTGSLEENVTLFESDGVRARDALACVGASGLLESTRSQRIGPGGRPLSGGESRQVAIARALCTGAPILLLDEPTEGLDDAAQRSVIETLRRVRAERALIVVTHRPELAAIADRVIAIGSGARASVPTARPVQLQN